MSNAAIGKSPKQPSTWHWRLPFGLAAVALVGTATLFAAHFLRARRQVSLGARRQVRIWSPLRAPRQIVANKVPDASLGTRERSVGYYKRVRAVQPKHFANILHRWRMEAANRTWAANPDIRAQMHFLFADSKPAAGRLTAAELLVLGPSGWRLRRSVSVAPGVWLQGEQHADQFLATCAEVGVPIDRAVQTPKGPVTIEELLRSSRLDFVADQETAWSTVAYCLYLPFNSRWKNRFGEYHSYEKVANAMMEGPLSEGNCWGTHRLYALAVMLQSDKEARFLPDRIRKRILDHLANTSARLVANQAQNGGWSSDWGRTGSADKAPVFNEAVDQMISVTAHHLEWIAIAPAQVRPNALSLEAAMQFLLTACEKRSSFDIDRRYCPYSHAARGLLLLSGADLKAD